jgi:hypothetical protein
VDDNDAVANLFGQASQHVLIDQTRLRLGSWAIAPVGWTGVSISCESMTLCLAGDENGNIYESAQPAGGASAWVGVHIDKRAVISLSCPLSTLCAGGDDTATY